MPRWLFEAVPLANGSALAVGGFGIASGGVLNSTEIFEPAEGGRPPYGAWRQVADMHTARQEFQLVTLDGGAVMAIGGFMALAEIYNPDQVRWQPRPRLTACEVYAQKSCGCCNALLHCSTRFPHKRYAAQALNRHWPKCLTKQSLI